MLSFVSQARRTSSLSSRDRHWTEHLLGPGASRTMFRGSSRCLRGRLAISLSLCTVIHWDGKVYTQGLLWSPGPDRTGSGLCFLQSWTSTTTLRVGQMLHFNSTTTVQMNWQVRGHLIFPLFLCPAPLLLQPLSHRGGSHTFTILAWAQLF